MYAPALGFLMFAVGVNLTLASFLNVFKHPEVESIHAHLRLSSNLHAFLVMRLNVKLSWMHVSTLTNRTAFACAVAAGGLSGPMGGQANPGFCCRPELCTSASAAKCRRHWAHSRGYAST